MDDVKQIRYADLIDDMEYLKVCGPCGGNGEYPQTYTVGCGGGYYQMMGRCDHCHGTGIRTINNTVVSRSHLRQLDTKREAGFQ